MTNQILRSTVDHLVVLAASLDEGARWCEKLLGVIPSTGGQHPLMGTHNRLVNISSFAYPDTYLEIIALDPEARSQRAPGLKRWFDLDDPVLHAQVARHGPQLIHFVARCPDVQSAAQAFSTLELDCGEVLAASRPTPEGLLQWRITVRNDGQRLLGGALPTLIQWGQPGEAEPSHPTQTLPYSGLQLQGLQLSHPTPVLIETACEVIGLAGMQVQAGTPGICATLQTQRGLVRLSSPPPL
jgi:hypothetical protein